MKIPIIVEGSKEYIEIELALLGFDLSKKEEQGEYNYYELPDNPNIQCKEEYPNVDHRRFIISLNGVPVISIHQSSRGSLSSYVGNVEKAVGYGIFIKPEIKEKPPTDVELKKLSEENGNVPVLIRTNNGYVIWGYKQEQWQRTELSSAEGRFFEHLFHYTNETGKLYKAEELNCLALNALKEVHIPASNNKQSVILGQKPCLTPFQLDVKHRLDELEMCITNAERGYGKQIGMCLSCLKHFMTENSDECRQLITSQKKYQELYAMFPGWDDVDDLQSYFEKMDRGVRVATLSPGRIQDVAVENLSTNRLSKAQERINKIKSEPVTPIAPFSMNEKADPEIMKLKSECFIYVGDIYQSVHQDELSKEVAQDKIEALKKLRQALDKATSIQSDKTSIETALNEVKGTLKKDQDVKAIRFLKQFGRILKAAFTGNYSLRQNESMQKFGTPKFWKSAQELRGKVFIKDVREHAKIEKPKKS